jgi:hypothetical protein
MDGLALLAVGAVGPVLPWRMYIMLKSAIIRNNNNNNNNNPFQNHSENT